MALNLARIHADCFGLLQAFAHDCKIPISLIPYLGTEIDITGTNPNCFSLEMAQNSVGIYFDQLKESLGRTKKREVAAIVEKRKQVVKNIEGYIELKAQHDTRVSAAFASAFVALGERQTK
jgi:TATA-binding protein-associated factor